MAGVYASLSSLAKVPQGQQRVSNARSEARYLLHGLPRLRSSPLSCNAAAQATSAFAAAAPTAAAVLEQQPGLSLLHHPDQLELLKQQLETKLHRPASPGSSSSTGSTLHVTTIQDSPAPAATEPIHRWGDGSGLTVEQFKAALQSLPMQQRVRWKSVYPAIGSGARGQVFQAVNLDTGGMLAVKVVQLAGHMGPGREAALRREALVLELAAMQDYCHPNLLAMQGFCFHASARKPRLEVFSELGCCLEDLMPDEGGPTLGLGLVQKVMQSVASALAFLHERGVVHRDVKAANILSVGPTGTFKLIDMDTVFFAKDSCEQQQQQQHGMTHYGVCQCSMSMTMGAPLPEAVSAHLAGNAAAKAAPPATGLQQQHQQPCAEGPDPAAACRELNALSFAGTPENMAPEAAPVVLERSVTLLDIFPLNPGRQAASSIPVDPAQDIWSMGTVLWELVTGRPLFDGFDSAEALYQHFETLRTASAAGNDSSSGSGATAVSQCVLLPVVPCGHDPDVVEVLEACLQLDPAKRPSSRELLGMKFFTKAY